MNRVDRRFRELRSAGRIGMIPYVTAGHPDPDSTIPILHAAVSAGADLLELGIPFSDMMADGPAIQSAARRALGHGTGLDEVLAAVAGFRCDDDATPIVLMGYMNPLERRGMSRFAAQASAAGVDGLLAVDCPVEEAGEIHGILADHGVHQIFLAAPTSTPERLARMAGLARGFIYYVSLKGVTGASGLDPDSLASAIGRVRSAIELPVAVGFGIRTPEQAAAVARTADAAVIGTALVECLDAAGGEADAAAAAAGFLAPLRAAIDNASSESSSGQILSG